MDKVSTLAYQLHEMLLQSKEYLSLKEAESIMLNNKEASNLIEIYHKVLEKYSSNKSDDVLKELHQAKLNMDLNELIMNYKEKYKDYQILLGKITEVVFEGFASTSTVDNCENNGKVSGGSWGSAGIVASCTGDITNCVNNGDIYAEGQLGGIVGKLESATAKVSNNVNNGSINGTTKDDLVAGIVGNVTVAGYTDELKTILTTC